MGAPKQKWNAEEVAALKAGVARHGCGKWCTILRDPEFRDILKLRSNVDLKDKWRNLSVTASGLGSRDKARMALKRMRRMSKDSKPDEYALAINTDAEDIDHDKAIDDRPLAKSSKALKIDGQNMSMERLEQLVVEAITKLDEPLGSSKMEIASYIEDMYTTPRAFKRLLSLKLKALTASQKLIKENRKYRLASSSDISKGRSSRALFREEKQKKPSVLENDGIELLISSNIFAQKSMTREEAAAYAAKQIAIAEIAFSEAEEAAREADAAQAEAEEAQALYEALVLEVEKHNCS